MRSRCGWSAISYRLNSSKATQRRALSCGWSAISYRLNWYTDAMLRHLRCGWSAISYRLNSILRQVSDFKRDLA